MLLGRTTSERFGFRAKGALKSEASSKSELEEPMMIGTTLTKPDDASYILEEKNCCSNIFDMLCFNSSNPEFDNKKSS
jgi:hypothetical protein